MNATRILYRTFVVSALLTLIANVPFASPQQSEYPIVDKVAQKVIDKYQTSSCGDLKAQKQAPQPADQAQMRQKVVTLLRNDPKMRAHFLNKVAGPIANKLSECGMLP